MVFIGAGWRVPARTWPDAGPRRTGKEYSEPEGGAQKTHRRRVVRHQLQPLPSGAVCHRVHVGPMENPDAAHEGAGQSSRDAGQGSPEVSPGGQWKLKKEFTHENTFPNSKCGGGSLRVGCGVDSTRGGDDQR